MTPTPLTERQRDCLALIQSGLSKAGHAPSIEEIRVALGYSGKSSAHRLVDALQERGRIQRCEGRARTITVLKPLTKAERKRTSLPDALRSMADRLEAVQ